MKCTCELLSSRRNDGDDDAVAAAVLFTPNPVGRRGKSRATVLELVRLSMRNAVSTFGTKILIGSTEMLQQPG